jgi:hypothetical protein
MGDVRFCPSCGEATRPPANYCVGCGDSLKETASGFSDVDQNPATSRFDAPALELDVNWNTIITPDYPVPFEQRFPWSRFAARLVDVWLFSFPAAFMLTAFGVGADSISGATFVVVLVAYPFAEGVSLRYFRTTPGKKLMNVRMIERRKATIADINGRSIEAHFRGFCGGLPIFCLIAAYLGYRRFLETGRTSWDDDSPIYASPRGAGLARWAGFAVMAAIMVLLAAIGHVSDPY